jgi:hypothetical protein
MRYKYKYLYKNIVLEKKTIFWTNHFLIKKTINNTIFVYDGYKLIPFNSNELKERIGFLLKNCFLNKKIGHIIHKKKSEKKRKKKK